MIRSVIIIGSGPAGHTSAIYTARAGLKPLMFEGFLAGGVPAGGQLTQTSKIENFPGFSDPITGIQLMDRMRKQSVKMGTEIRMETIIRVDLSSYPFKVMVESEDFSTKALIIATGATARRMNLLNEENYWQKGISACAVCDGALPLFRNQELAVVGGGDTACEEATYLTRYASKVHMLLRRDEFRASFIMKERILRNPKIQVHFNTVPIEVLGNGKAITELKLQDIKTKEESRLPVRGLFYAIGHDPATQFLYGQLEQDEAGYLKVKEEVKTSVRGVFACGDVVDRIYRQAIVAAGSGCKAGLEVIRYLESLKN